MGSLRVPEAVPPPDQDCERLKKAFDGIALLLLLSHINDGLLSKRLCLDGFFIFFIQCPLMGHWRISTLWVLVLEFSDSLSFFQLISLNYSWFNR
jgi:hypothetical protein